jgi:photosystem II stability/assembly factor-like uncharacterized protein
MIPGLCLAMLLAAVLACGPTTPVPTEPPAGATPSQTPEPPTLDTATPTEPPPTAVPTDTPEPTLTPTETPTLEPVIITYIAMIDTSNGWGIGSLTGDDNHVLRTSDGGHTWTDVTPPEPSLATKHATGFFVDNNHAWVTYYPSTIGSPPYSFYTWNTTNGGTSWTQSAAQSVEFLGSINTPPYMHFSDANTGWIMLRLGAAGMHKYPVYLMRTLNGGATWDMLIDPFGAVFLQSCRKTGMHFSGSLTGWVTFDNCPTTEPAVIVTDDGGATWSDIVLPPPASEPSLFANAFCFTYSPNLLSPTSGGLVSHCTLYSDPTTTLDYVYRTADGGSSWIGYDYPGGPLLLLNSNIGFALDNQIHRTDDGCVSWTHIGTTSWDGQFSFVSQLYAWAVARAGTSIALVKSATGASSWGLLNPVLAP